MPVPMVPLPGRQSQNLILYWHLNEGKNLHSPTGVDLMLWSLQKWCAASHLWTATQHFLFFMQLAINSEETGSAPIFVKGKTKAVQSFTIAELCNKVQNAITNSKQGQILFKGCWIECRFQWYHCQAVKAKIWFSIGIWMRAKTYIAQQVLTLCYEVCQNGALPVIYELPHSNSHSSCNLQSTQKRRAAHHFLLKKKPKQCNHLQ